MFDFFPSLSTVISLLAVIVAIVVVALAVFLRRVVPTNMVHIVQTRRQTTEYGRGREAGNAYYEIPSWVPFFGVVVTSFPESNFPVTLNNYSAYDTNRLPFTVDISAFFRIDKAAEAAQRVASFGELQEQLRSILSDAIRSILASGQLEEILHARASLADDFTKAVDEQLKEWGVKTVKSIAFMDIRDTQGSQVIQQIMEKEMSRIDRESRSAVAENNRAAEEAEIKAAQEVQLKKQAAEQNVGVNKAKVMQEVGLANEKSKQEVATQAAITAERDMAVKQVNETRAAEIAKDVAVVRAEEQRQVESIHAETAKSVALTNAAADKESGITKADGERQAVQLIAAGNLEVALKDAQGIQAVGEAKAAALKAELQAPVDTQINLAKEIGSNEGYQVFLINTEQVKANMAVGIEMAKALANADLRVFANGGTMQGGMNNLTDMFSSNGGTQLTALAQVLDSSDAGRKVLDGLTTAMGNGLTAAATGSVAGGLTGDSGIAAATAAGTAVNR